MPRRLPSVPDCVNCGACCIAQWDDDRYVMLNERDARVLEEAGHAELIVADKNEWNDDVFRALRTKTSPEGHCVCVGLFGLVGESVRCDIYDARPEPCRHFQPGSLECCAARDDAMIDV